MNEKAFEIWSEKWPPYLHTDEYAKKRIESAKSAKLTPIRIDEDDLFGYFQGGHGKYETFLDSCPCGDFIRAKRPCKHMYRLAMELGLIEAKFATDASRIVTPKKERMTLDATIDMVESFSEELQYRVLQIYETFASPTREHVAIEPIDDGLKELLEIGIVVELLDSEKSLQYTTIDALKKRLDKLGLPYNSNLKGKRLMNYCTEHYFDELSAFYPVCMKVVAPPYITVRNVHFYLHRKFGVDEFSGFPLLETILPDDAITAQLIKRGYYTPSEE